jgi:hypothetical protein
MKRDNEIRGLTAVLSSDPEIATRSAFPASVPLIWNAAQKQEVEGNTGDPVSETCHRIDCMLLEFPSMRSSTVKVQSISLVPDDHTAIARE